MKIVFMGTPDFALEPLRALVQAGHELCLVLTKEDKKRDRGVFSPTPVKELAEGLQIPVLTPSRMKDPALLETLKNQEADVFVVVAYGKILPREILEIPRYGCINIHASLLPAYRGAAPIQWAILSGEKKTGITTMHMDEGLDTGDILRQYEIPIAKDETGGSLFEKLAKLGGEAIVDTLAHLFEIKPQKQGEMTTDYASMMTKSMGALDFSKSPEVLERQVRGLSPWPGTFSHLQGKILKIKKVGLVPDPGEVLERELSGEASFGKLVTASGRLFVVCQGGLLELLELQPQGKKAMSARDFLSGRHGAAGMELS